MIDRSISIFIPYSFLKITLVRKTRFSTFFTELNCKSEEALGRSMGHVNLKSGSFSYSSFLSLVDVRNCIRSTVWNILNIWVLRKFYFGHDLIVLRSVSRQKNLQKFIFAKSMEMQKRMSYSKYKHSLYIIPFIRFNLPFFRKRTL